MHSLKKIKEVNQSFSLNKFFNVGEFKIDKVLLVAERNKNFILQNLRTKFNFFNFRIKA